ncbi:hypothetical protein PAPYR_3429 [Paratrimastix pyriformis]|uniref:FYVE-type domain-containing protein n=1 Tax=Paratrimastix pyriformis TaxID=342808 RepID=A0ABQ8USS0_9EUKA|nr:hypothetical protein PAPYR_3429 [Paratrimastix pyriformis]
MADPRNKDHFTAVFHTAMNLINQGSECKDQGNLHDAMERANLAMEHLSEAQKLRSSLADLDPQMKQRWLVLLDQEFQRCAQLIKDCEQDSASSRESRGMFPAVSVDQPRTRRGPNPEWDSISDSVFGTGGADSPPAANLPPRTTAFPRWGPASSFAPAPAPLARTPPPVPEPARARAPSPATERPDAWPSGSGSGGSGSGGRPQRVDPDAMGAAYMQEELQRESRAAAAAPRPGGILPARVVSQPLPAPPSSFGSSEREKAAPAPLRTTGERWGGLPSFGSDSPAASPPDSPTAGSGPESPFGQPPPASGGTSGGAGGRTMPPPPLQRQSSRVPPAPALEHFRVERTTRRTGPYPAALVMTVLRRLMLQLVLTRPVSGPRGMGSPAGGWAEAVVADGPSVPLTDGGSLDGSLAQPVVTPYGAMAQVPSSGSVGSPAGESAGASPIAPTSAGSAPPSAGGAPSRLPPAPPAFASRYSPAIPAQPAPRALPPPSLPSALGPAGSPSPTATPPAPGSAGGAPPESPTGGQPADVPEPPRSASPEGPRAGGRRSGTASGRITGASEPRHLTRDDDTVLVDRIRQEAGLQRDLTISFMEAHHHKKALFAEKRSQCIQVQRLVAVFAQNPKKPKPKLCDSCRVPVGMLAGGTYCAGCSMFFCQACSRSLADKMYSARGLSDDADPRKYPVCRVCAEKLDWLELQRRVLQAQAEADSVPSKSFNLLTVSENELRGVLARAREAMDDLAAAGVAPAPAALQVRTPGRAGQGHGGGGRLSGCSWLGGRDGGRAGQGVRELMDKASALVMRIVAQTKEVTEVIERGDELGLGLTALDKVILRQLGSAFKARLKRWTDQIHALDENRALTATSIPSSGAQLQKDIVGAPR